MDIDQTILSMKKEGKSLREIASSLGVGKSTVSRKIRAMGHSLNGGTVNAPQKGKCPTSSKSCRSRVTDEKGVADNQGGTVRLFEAIRGFLGIRGSELYRIDCEFEAYQVRDDTQVVRLYVQRCPKSNLEKEGM